MSTGKVVSGVLAGLAVGTVLGILFAPHKGSKTRRKIMEKGNDCVDSLKSKCSNLTDSLKSQFENVSQEATDLAEKAKAKYDNLKNEIQGNM